MKRHKQGHESPERKVRKKHRTRPTPDWLETGKELNEVAQRRCLAILSVLSGEKSVTEVVEETKVSRQTYYHLEERGLRGMLSALLPGSETEAGTGGATEELHEKLATAEKGRRRLKRLLFLTRKVMKKGPITAGPGRPKRRWSARNSIRSGGKSSNESSPPNSPPSSKEADGRSSPVTSGADGL